MATIVSATTASADMTITPSQAYCVGTTYSVTLPAADAAALWAQMPAVETALNEWALVETPSAGSGLSTTVSAPVKYVAGQDVTVQWAPPAAGQWQLMMAPFSQGGYGTPFGGPLAVTVVQSAPAGSSCTPPTSGGTGSANSIPVIGGLLSSLSAQK
ncbi:hypothetical protein [Nocardia sp. NBC_01327]|uniref:hypothetical protein n=1 Tax=Nocardia sp. NBC_01327 TaxID=2903593 RepID=UPI002E149906|nr:hypothetical protein OG326_36870 [Nocardia sp. NBC_01327]